MSARWAAIICAAEPQRHLVITALPPDPSAARSILRNLTKAIRRGQALGVGSRRDHAIEHEYFATLESNRSGYIHAHLLQRGASIPIRNLSRLCAAYGAGRVAWIKSITAYDRPQAVTQYVANHLVGVVHCDQAKAGRRIRYSRNFWSGKTTAQVRADLWPKSDPYPDITWSLIGPGHVADDGAVRRRLAEPLCPAALALLKEIDGDH